MITISSLHKEHNHYYFNIANVSIELVSDREIKITDPFREFDMGSLEKNGNLNTDTRYVVHYKCIEKLPTYDEKVIYQSDKYKVLDGEAEIRVFFEEDPDHDCYAATMQQLDQNQIQVTYLEEGKPFLDESGNSFFHIGWEAILAKENRLIFHSCAVDSICGGILFSGDSGIGKSTQGNLWEKYEQAEIINGDRPIICKEGSEWYAYGSPYAGSSRIHKNQKCPVKAIVMLQQSGSNSIRRLGQMEAFQKVYAQMTVNTWSKGFVEKALNLTEQLIVDVPVYELSCTPDQRAVALLKETLIGGE